MKDNELTMVEKLNAFVNQKPGLDANDYNDSQSYNHTVREITKDRNDYYELLSLFLTRWEGNANVVLTAHLIESDGRLRLIKGRSSLSILEYTTGQYFPTEYRKAANRVLVTLIWQSFRDERIANGNAKTGVTLSGQPVYKDGHEIRKAIAARVSIRVMKLYFN